LLLLVSCSSNNSTINSTLLFTKIHSSETGVNFANNLQETEALNYFTYTSIYMGGSVSVGDINNDGLEDLFFTGNQVHNGLYLNKGGLKFENISKKANIIGDKRWYTGSTMADVNNDGYLDIYCAGKLSVFSSFYI